MSVLCVYSEWSLGDLWVCFKCCIDHVVLILSEHCVTDWGWAQWKSLKELKIYSFTFCHRSNVEEREKYGLDTLTLVKVHKVKRSKPDGASIKYIEGQSVKFEVAKVCWNAPQINSGSIRMSHVGFSGRIRSAKRCELDVFCRSQSRVKHMMRHSDRSLFDKKSPTWWKLELGNVLSWQMYTF